MVILHGAKLTPVIHHGEVTPVIHHGVVIPDSGHPARGCIPRRLVLLSPGYPGDIAVEPHSNGHDLYHNFLSAIQETLLALSHPIGLHSNVYDLYHNCLDEPFLQGTGGLSPFPNLIRKEFQFNKLLAMKFTTRML